MTELAGKRILLGLTGGIAAYKAGELARLFVRSGADVQVVMTRAACGFVTPATMQALSGKPVYTDMWDGRIPNNMGHIELSRDRDLIVVAPASADFMAKLANGLADDLLSALCLARRSPLAVAPAMNVEMWNHPATQRNAAQLRADGVAILGPASGDQACGETGMGRMLEAAEIYAEAVRALSPKVLEGKRVLVTAGPTYEPIDTVRGITNQSSGKMGYAVAQAAAEAGAQVTLVSGRTALPTPAAVERVDVVTAREMHDAVMARVKRTDVFIAVAAVADYHVVNARGQKIKRSAGNPKIELAPNPDILGAVAAGKSAPFCVGFAAETENLKAYAQDKRHQKGIPLLAANLAQEAFGRDDNALTLFDDAGEHVLARAPKIVLARQLVAHIARMLPKAR
ncbi:MAG: phosphopantothenate synthase [Betaproteobacteria bacterium RBG_16_64_18]|nr:MAG: phosphopantothenate synthase [Betaproteobacteria bacterium RBG_16_64_18]OGA12498.1 MAG: phosphopantothenate synthase [Betaproteobacteria bacterium RIFCSPLOWO2_02_FULL_65_20]OGA41659.1 MAG: phosphopantothenate synthase [Betaproteobacteria bacterium RIFCSPLOWO2_12_FULL_65_110]